MPWHSLWHRSSAYVQVRVFDCGGEFFLTCTSPVTHFILPPYSPLYSSPNQIKAQSVSHFVIFQRIPSKDMAHPFRHRIAEAGRQKRWGRRYIVKECLLESILLIPDICWILFFPGHCMHRWFQPLIQNKVFKRYFVKAEITW